MRLLKSIFLSVLVVCFCITGVATAKERSQDMAIPENYKVNESTSLDEIVVLYEEDFEDGYADWSIIDGGTPGDNPYYTWAFSDSLQPDSEYQSFWSMTSKFMFVNSDTCGVGVMLEERLVSPAIDFSSANGDPLFIALDMHKTTYMDSSIFEFSTIGPDGPWESSVSYSPSLIGHLTLPLPDELIGESSVWMSIYYNDNGDWSYGLAVDNLEIYSHSEYSLTGVIYENNLDGDPLEGVEVYANNELVMTTGIDGAYTFTDLEGYYDIKFLKESYIPVSIDSFNLDQTQTYDEALAFVDGTVSTNYISILVGLDSTATETFTVENTGFGPLEWSTSVAILTEPWENAASEGTASHSELDFLGDFIQRTRLNFEGWGSAGGVTPEGIFFSRSYFAPDPYYHFDFEGNLVSETVFPLNQSPYGDFAYDPYNNLFYACSQTGDIYSFVPENPTDATTTLIANLGDFGAAFGVGLDFENNILYCTSFFNGAFGALDLSTNTFTTLAAPPYGPRGVAYMPTDPEGATIWVDCMFDPDTPNRGFYRYNPSTDTWDTEPYIYVPEECETDHVMGFEISNVIRPGFWDLVFFTSINEDGTYLNVVEGYPAAPSFLYVDEDTRSGILENNGDTQEITIHADVTEAQLGEPIPIENGSTGTANVYVSASSWPTTETVEVLVTFNVTTGVNDEDVLPSQFALHQNYPNPFNPRTEIVFELPQAIHTKLTIYNVLGQRVVDLIDQPMKAGVNILRFDASKLSSGTYYYRLEAGEYKSIRKMQLVK